MRSSSPRSRSNRPLPRPRRLSGPEAVAALERHGVRVVSVRGSHAKLRRTGAGGERQTLVVPLHDELAPGTLRAIVRQASRFVAEEELRGDFFAD
ncbi:type II toxin-antitoxin system HicA family toxin [Tepidiforma flava]|uniref:type II toxin-antitoxin system HicA family toxin n=1 Tax=Tepidiforma flava TaxID=3004094 RepID=UPI0035716E6D